MYKLSLLLGIVTALLCQETLAQKSTSCNCGWVNKGRIVGGKAATKNQFPWMAALWSHTESKVACGATIVTRYHAITAGHCEPYLHMTNLLLVVGLHDTRKLNEATKLGIEKIVLHPQYNSSGFVNNDIAVVVAASPIPFSNNVGPACLPTGRIDLDEEDVTAIGWGQEGFNLAQSPVLKSVVQSILPHNACKLYWGGLAEPKSQLCGLQRNAGVCMGDSGGPLVWMDPETRRYTLVGIPSYVKECSFPPPAVYTEVAAFMPWVKKTIQGNKPEKICTKV